MKRTIELLKKNNELRVIEEELDIYLEIPHLAYAEVKKKDGGKALLFTNGKEEFVIVNIPADRRVDQKKVAQAIGWPKGAVRMATQEEVMEKTGCEIGAVPPFGHKNAIPILIDKGVYENQENAFNIGLRTKSVKIKTAEMKVLFEKEKVLEGTFVKDSEIKS